MKFDACRCSQWSVLWPKIMKWLAHLSMWIGRQIHKQRTCNCSGLLSYESQEYLRGSGSQRALLVRRMRLHKWDDLFGRWIDAEKGAMGCIVLRRLEAAFLARQ